MFIYPLNEEEIPRLLEHLFRMSGYTEDIPALRHLRRNDFLIVILLTVKYGYTAVNLFNKQYPSKLVWQCQTGQAEMLFGL